MTDEAKYVKRAIATFLVDPPDTEYQCGFLAALLVLAKEAFHMDDPLFTKAEALLRPQIDRIERTM